MEQLEAQAAMQLEALGKPGLVRFIHTASAATIRVYNMDTGPMWPELMRDRYTDNVPVNNIRKVS